MNKTFLIALLAALVAAPFTDAEAPVIHCETNFSVHHYTEGNGRALTGWGDGNLDDCDGDFDPSDPYCVAEEVAREDLNGDGLVCEATDYDGHHEWSAGGAILLSDDGDLTTYGAFVCFGENAHHPQYGPFSVNDVVLGAGASFVVGADTVNLVGPDPVTGLDCGDFEVNRRKTCTGSCTVLFPAGIDGAYYIYVSGGAGTVTG